MSAQQAIEPGQADSSLNHQDRANAQNENNGTSYFSVIKGFIVRALIIYFITSFFRKSTTPNTTSSNDSQSPQTQLAGSNLFSIGTNTDFYVYLSESEKLNFLDSPNLVWLKRNIVYGDWSEAENGDGVVSHSVNFPTSQNVKNNGSVYIHAFLVKSGYSPNPKDKKYSKQNLVAISQRLNKYKKRRFKKTSNLLTGVTQLTDEEVKKAESEVVEITSHWHPNITLNVVYDFTPWVRGSIPPPIDEFIDFTPSGDGYKPILSFNTYWNLNKEYQPLNDTIQDLNLTVTYQPLSLFKWQMYAAQAMKNRFSGAAILEQFNVASEEQDEVEQDALKEVFLETSPYLLALTMIVSVTHSVFEMLAFKNDVQFWNNRKSLEGLSVRSVFFNVFQALIVLLYVMDNETNFLIKVSCFVGLGIEVWKITKVTNVSLNRERRILGIPTLKFEDKGTYVHSQTKIYDEMAFKYLGILLFPLLGGYVVYSLFYQEHKGWYSFVLSMLYGFLLTFGFIMMTPQLFINYKMKSVAHLPWRMLTYKALNTFIDDIFAFIIKMPTLYRLGCLRDDVVFFIFLYQRYIYPIDPTRLNEFGFSKEHEEAKGKELSDGGAKETTESLENEAPKSNKEKKDD